LDDLLEHVTATFPIDVARASKAEHPVKESTAAEHAKESPRIKVAIIGRPNVGK
jgi:predicted GTPase